MRPPLDIRSGMTRAAPAADVIVAGGGLSGLSCGMALAEAGLRVLLLEADTQLGGRARSCTDSHTGDRIDLGPHILHSYYPNMLNLLERLGTLDLISWSGRTLATISASPRPHPIRLAPLPAPLHLIPGGLQLPYLRLRDKLSMLRAAWFITGLRKQDLAALDRLDAETLLRALGVTELAIDRIWRHAAMAIINVPLHKCSAAALMRFARQGLGHSDVRLGFPAVGLGDLFVPGCVRRIEQAGGAVRTGVRVTRMLERGGVFKGVELPNGTRITARAGVLATPPQTLPTLLPRPAALPHQRLGDLEPSTYISTYLWFAEKLTRQQCWTQLWSPDTLNYDFYDLSNIRQGWHGRPSVIACNLIYSQRLGDIGDAEVLVRSREEIAAHLPAAATTALLHHRIHRIPMAIPCTTPGQDSTRPATRTATRNLFLASDWVDTGIPVCMESATRAGFLAAEQAAAACGKTLALAEELPEPGGLCRVRRWGTTANHVIKGPGI